MQLIKETNLYDDDAISEALLQTVSNIFYDENMFNILTHNSAIQGLFWEDGQVYANMTYLKSGQFVLGEVNNKSGSMIVKDSNGNLIGKWDKDGLDVGKGSISGANITLGGSGNTYGYVSILNASGTEIGRWDRNGIVASGTITTTNGNIGGFTIGSTNIHNGMTSLSDTTHNGVYVGTDGIALGKGAFKVTSAGAVNASNITVTGGSITGNAITAGKISSANGLVYFDLTNNELRCSKIIDATTNASNRISTVLEVGKKTLRARSSASGYAVTGISIYDPNTTGSYSYPIGMGINAGTDTTMPYLWSPSGINIGLSGSLAILNTGNEAGLLIGNSALLTYRNNIGSWIGSHKSSRISGEGEGVAMETNYLVLYSGQHMYLNSIYLHLCPTQPVMMESAIASGFKSRQVSTDNYGDRLLYCYETPSPMFGDVGEGTIAEDGKCYIWFDSIFAETVSLSQYQVFLQKYGNGDCWVSEKNSVFFIVEGTPGLSFGWEAKAKQSDFDQYRLENNNRIYPNDPTNYGLELEKHIEDIQHEREVAA